MIRILIPLLLLVGCGPTQLLPPPAIPAAAYADLPPQPQVREERVEKVDKAQPVKETKTVNERLDHLEGQLSWMRKRLGGNK